MDGEAVLTRIPIGVLVQVAAFCEDPQQRKLVLNKGDQEYKWEMCQYGKVTG